MRTTTLKSKLESVYTRYNKREYVDPDPLCFLFDYPELRDREIIGLVSACLAYGRVEMIMKTVGSVIYRLGPSPYTYITEAGTEDFNRDFAGFRYRFAVDTHIINLLIGIKSVIRDYDSIEYCFASGLSPTDGTVFPGLVALFRKITETGCVGHLLPDPSKNSACKRSHLFLRWMVRKDSVDPGGWETVAPSSLVIPLDTHMYRIGTLLGFTKRKSRDIKTAVEITRGFRRIQPDDPVKYDFCLTRYGIRADFDFDDLQKTFHLSE